MIDMNSDIVRLGLSLALGSAIGLEREVSDKSAGLRTNVLISVGATLFTLVSLKLASISDPARVAAQIVTGIGFIGAGSIMRDGDRVTGLTTAATIWTVAAIGMSVGFGYYILACMTTAIALLIQLVYTPLDALIDDLRERHTFRVVSKLDDASLEQITQVFRHAHLKVIRKKIMKKNGGYYSEWYTSGPRMVQEKVTQALLDNKHVLEVTY